MAHEIVSSSFLLNDRDVYTKGFLKTAVRDLKPPIRIDAKNLQFKKQNIRNKD